MRQMLGAVIWFWLGCTLFSGLILLGGTRWAGGDEPQATTPADAASKEANPPAAAKPLEPDPPGMTRLLPAANAWLDLKGKRVVVDGVVCLQSGNLEMFACLSGTKEHESVVAVDVEAFAIHAALLRVGAKAGSPVKFRPAFQAAFGTPIDVTVIWQEGKKTHTARAQEWVRDVRTGKALDLDWVFAGSSFHADDQGKEHYQAEGGDLICVSNFPDAMLDLPVESSQATSDLRFEAFTEHVPPIGTKVRLVLTPRAEKKK